MDMGETHESLEEKLKKAVDSNDMVDGVHVRLMVIRGEKKPFAGSSTDSEISYYCHYS